ncbi:hypothetical protein HGM15179_008967 [Zosterops borbonicus]|uniref:Uncharacterized protein n=1 Tax=Zosterops borbonicus TaxID=364589 RepID=A0A8K1GH60_9PASS|nr:hypothetical protein HGM15179_008967 [Zosterops borbonicus]
MEEAFDNWKRAKKLSKEMKLDQFYSGVKIMTCPLRPCVLPHEGGEGDQGLQVCRWCRIRDRCTRTGQLSIGTRVCGKDEFSMSLGKQKRTALPSAGRAPEVIACEIMDSSGEKTLGPGELGRT